MWKLSPFSIPLLNLFEGILDSCREPVTPKAGSIVYCDLAFGYVEHSGVYVGNNKIVHLNRRGMIETVTPKQFIAGTTAINIYVSCKDSEVTADSIVAENAIYYAELIQSDDYNLILNNCHHFFFHAKTGIRDNSDITLWLLKDTCNTYMQSNTWRHWDDNFD